MQLSSKGHLLINDAKELDAFIYYEFVVALVTLRKRIYDPIVYTLMFWFLQLSYKFYLSHDLSTIMPEQSQRCRSVGDRVHC